MKLTQRALSKLVINAYLDREMKNSAGTIEAMYNPASINLQYAGNYHTIEGLNRKQVTNQFSAMQPGILSLELVFDAKLPGNNESIEEQLNRLRAICCDVDKITKETHFLQVKWGKMRWHGSGYFAGRVQSLEVSYTLFERDASVLHAVARLELKADESLVLQKSAQGMKAPKTLAVTVPALTTLPMMAASAGAAVGDLALDYLTLAALNGLDNLSDIVPGKQLIATAKTRE